MEYTFVFCPNLLGLMALLLLLVFTRFNFYLDKAKLKLFVIVACVNIMIIVFGVIDYFLSESGFEIAYLLRRITSALGFALSPVIPLLISYIATTKKLPIIILFPAIANVIMSICSIFTGHMFEIDADNLYSRGPLFYVMVAISIFYLSVLVYISFRNLRRVRFLESIFLFVMAFIIIIGNLLEIVLSFYFLTWNCCAILLICYYLFLHIQYFKLDPLTNVYNRNMFNYDSEKLNGKSGIGIISFDLNGLKKINDEKGHKAGDCYIISAAILLEKCFLSAGKLYRIGGDEFVVIMTDTTEAIIQSKIKNFEESSRITDVSLACGYSYAENDVNISTIMQIADKAMYEDKRKGRTRA